MTLIVNQLETFDKSNLEVIRIEFAKLQKKLEECQKEQELIKPDIGETTSKKIVDSGLKIKHCQPVSIFSLSFQATVITLESWPSASQWWSN